MVELAGKEDESTIYAWMTKKEYQLLADGSAIIESDVLKLMQIWFTLKDKRHNNDGSAIPEASRTISNSNVSTYV